MKKLFIVTFLLSFAITNMACSNPETPTGHEGYVTMTPMAFGTSEFRTSQTGPTSTGLGWRLYVQNIDFRWATVTESFRIMSFDNLMLNFNAHVVIRPAPGSIQSIVEVYGAENWYTRFLKEPFRNAVYEAVAEYNALDAKDHRTEIAAEAAVKFAEHLNDKPFEIESIVIGTIGLPAVVNDAQEQKIKKETEEVQKEFELNIAKKDAQIRVEEAKGIAKAQEIINTTLTDRYLQHEAIQAQLKMAESPNHTTVYIPAGNNGIPIIKTID